MWSLLLAVFFFAVGWLLGKLLNIESVHQISRIAFLLAVVVFLITNPWKPLRWTLQALDWLYRAKPLSSLLKDEREAVVWSLSIAEVASAVTYWLAKVFESDALRFVATIAFLLFSTVIVILALPLLFRCFVRALWRLFSGARWMLEFVWRCYRWLNFRRVIYLFLGFCGLVLLAYAEEDLRGWWAWQRFKHEWEARGERFDYASVIPPRVPDEQNFALTPIVASCYEWGLTKDGQRLTPFRTNVVDRLRMDVYHASSLTVSRITPTNGDWTVGKMCDLKSWQMYYRTAATNEVLVVEKTPQGESRYWKPGSMLTNDFEFPPVPQSPAADVLLALSKYDSTIEELREASALSYSRFPLNYEGMLHDSTNQPVVMLMHLASIRSCIPVLNLRAIAELENGQSNKALDDVKLEFRLVNATRVEPNLISHRLRTEEMKIVLQAVWEGLAKHQWTDAQLTAIEQELGKLDFLGDSQLAMRGERNQNFALLDYFRRARPYQEFRQMFAPIFMSPGSEEEWRRIEREQTYEAIKMCLIPSGWFYQDKLALGKEYQQWALLTTDSAKHLAYPEVVQNGEKFASSLPQRPWNTFACRLGGGFGATVRRLIYAQETTDLARVACALERYRLAHDGYPDSLDALAPQFVDKVPHDIIGGKPLHYRPTAGAKYLFYSVGWNGVDDGGKVGFGGSSDRPNNWLGDWVWPCDSSPVGAIYDRP